MREDVSPLVRWVPVVDGSGRRRLEMRWALSAPAVAVAVRGTRRRAA